MNAIVTALSVVFIVVSANHLGLISAIEDTLNCRIPVLNCVKCGSFWGSLIALLVVSKDVIGSVAMAFVFAYLAIWLELAMCVVDKRYKKIYEKIVSEPATDTSAASTESGAADRSVPELQE